MTSMKSGWFFINGRTTELIHSLRRRWSGYSEKELVRRSNELPAEKHLAPVSDSRLAPQCSRLCEVLLRAESFGARRCG